MLNELQAFVILNSIPGLGSSKIRSLLQHFGTAVEALKTSAKQIVSLPGFENIARAWHHWETDRTWEKDLALASQQGVNLIPYTSPQFPKQLLSIPDHPILLYVKGTLLPEDQRCIAVVGTRNASIYGNEMAAAISKDLAASGFTVISGLARGIDTSAHHGAISTGRTIAVIGSGLSRIYPPENRLLAQNISQKGALITEFSMNVPPGRHNFPQRNRIVSGISLATVLIEAPLKSGAMITAEKAFAQHRKLFCLPGRADNENFQGNHFLIKNRQAILIENAKDVLNHFQQLIPNPSIPTQSMPLLSPEENDLLKKMPKEETTIDSLLITSQLPIQHLNRILMSLILKRAIKEFPGKIYKKLLG